MGRTGNKGQNTKVRVTKRYSLSRKRSGVELFELFLYQEGTALQAPRGYPARDQVQKEKVSVRGTPGLGPMPVGLEEPQFSAAWWAPYTAPGRELVLVPEQ